MTQPVRISILEDSMQLQELLTESLTEEGFVTKCYSLANEFERDLLNWKPSVSIVDLGLPDKDGLTTLSKIGDKNDTAILVISGRTSLSDKIASFELGADDYLAKPFEMPELIVRVRALLRRKQTTLPERQLSDTTRLPGWTVHPSQFLIVHDDGHEESLSSSEMALLNVFLKRPNHVVTRDQLREELDSRVDELSFDRAIDVRISRLRSKLRDKSKDPNIIKTIYGAGYILINNE